MRVLVTGSRGLAGSVVVETMTEAGHSVVEFDFQDGHDIRDLETVRRETRGCDAIIHLAALLGRPGESETEIMAVNSLGTWNVLLAAEETRVSRVVFVSSVNALGIFMGQRPPDYFPIDDEHPCYPNGAYGTSKWLAEEMCGIFTERTGIATICLRPPAIWNEDLKCSIIEARDREPESEWCPFWEYGAFLDVRDMASAAIRALHCPDPGHVRLLINADDISSAGMTSPELVEKLHPTVPWKGGSRYEDDPYRALVDCERAKKILGWAPQHNWRG